MLVNIAFEAPKNNTKSNRLTTYFKYYETCFEFHEASEAKFRIFRLFASITFSLTFQDLALTFRNVILFPVRGPL